jgi:hypothetical protein
VGANVACMTTVRDEYKMFLGKMMGTDHLRNLSVDGRISEWILEKQCVR